MNDDVRPPGIEAVDNQQVGPAPVGDLLHAGHAARRRRRTVIAGVAAVTVLLVGGGFATTQVLGDDANGDDVVVTDGNTTTAGPSLMVDVRMGSYPPQPPAGTATWDPDERVVRYSMLGVYSGSCPPEGSATTSSPGLVRLVLTTDRAEEEDCTADDRIMIATIDGLTGPPAELLVAEDGNERRVTVGTHDITIKASRDPASEVVYEEGALAEISLIREGASGSVRSEARSSPWTQEWPDLGPGAYVIRAAARPCAGSCDYLDPPADTCEQAITLDTDLAVNVEFTNGEPCTITITSDDHTGDINTRTVDLPTSDWPASGVSREARITGVLKVDDDNCVYLTNGGKDTPTSRAYAVWPAGFSATIDPDGNLALVDGDGETVASDGDALVTGGGYEPNPGTEPCLPDFAAEVAYIESEVEVERP